MRVTPDSGSLGLYIKLLAGSPHRQSSTAHGTHSLPPVLLNGWEKAGTYSS